MNERFIDELRTLLAGKFTGTVVLHCHAGSIKMYEVNERRRPRPDDGHVELVEGR